MIAVVEWDDWKESPVESEILLASTMPTLFVSTLSLIVAVPNLVNYWSIKSEKVASIRDMQRRFVNNKSIVWPTLISLLTGVLFSLSASYIYNAINHKSLLLFSIAAVIILFATLMLLLVLPPVLNQAFSVAALARSPQRIAAAALEIVPEEAAAAEQLAALKRSYRNWQSARGAHAMFWNKIPESVKLNEAFSDIPASESLPMRKAVHTLKWRKAIVAAFRMAPWRFGWLLFLQAALVALVVAVSVCAHELMLVGLMLALVAALVALVGILANMATDLLLAARRLSLATFHASACAQNLRIAEKRVSDQLSVQARRLQMWKRSDRIERKLDRLISGGLVAILARFALGAFGKQR